MVCILDRLAVLLEHIKVVDGNNEMSDDDRMLHR